MAEKQVKDWITVNHKHIPIYDGESKQDAVNRAIAKDNEEQKAKQIENNKKQAEQASGKSKLTNNQSTIESFDIKSLGDLKDADDLHEFIQENIDNDKFKQFGKDNSMEAVQQLWYENKRQQEIKDLKEVKIEDAIQTVRDNIKASHISGWFRNGDSGYKPRIAEQMLSNKGTLNAALNIAYQNYKNQLELQNIRNDKSDKPMSFKDWLTTPVKVYRGTSGQKLVKDDVFTSFTPDKKIAEDFAHGRNSAAGSSHGGEPKVESRVIRPIDTWGQLQTNGEYEFMIPLSIAEKSKQRK